MAGRTSSAFDRKILSWYNFGALLLLLGLLWMFLPHTTHEVVLGGVEQDGESHFSHTLQGAVAALAGLGIMIPLSRRESRKKRQAKKPRKA